DDDLGITIHTIGVGASPSFESELADISNATGGLTKITQAPDEDLRQFFVEELVEVLRDFSPQLVDYRRGAFTQRKEESFEINNTAQKVIFKVSYDRGDEVGVQISKGGVDVSKLAEYTRGAHYLIISFPFERLLTFQAPMYEGDWTLTLTSGAGAVDYEIAAIADEASLDYQIYEGANQYVGSPLNLNAEISVNGVKITNGVTVTATIKKPGEGLGTILSTTNVATASGLPDELGLSLGAQKLASIQLNAALAEKIRWVQQTETLSPDAGQVFRGEYLGTSVPGTYTITYVIEGEHPFTGPFRRVEQRSVVIRFASFDFSLSDVLTSVRSEGLQQVWTWTFTPKDAFGNYLGPDYAHLLNLSSIDGDIKNLKDLGNGSYRFEIWTDTEEEPRVQIGLYDEVWYDDPVPSPSTGRWHLSLHGGGAIPNQAMDSVYNAGVYGKLDIEYRLNARLSGQFIAGINGFGGGLNAGFGALQIKAYLPIGKRIDFFGEVGPGVYRLFGENIIGGGTYAGLDFGFGFDWSLTDRFRLGLGGNFVHVFNHPNDFKWLNLGLGVHYAF
ncbi:MAG: hypothetical protein AAGH79_05450, partial [Bacteroidota bacterium]